MFGLKSNDFHPHEVVGRGRQTQLQVVKGPNEICMDNAGLMPLADVVHNFDWNQIAD